MKLNRAWPPALVCVLYSPVSTIMLYTSPQLFHWFGGYVKKADLWSGLDFCNVPMFVLCLMLGSGGIRTSECGAIATAEGPRGYLEGDTLTWMDG